MPIVAKDRMFARFGFAQYRSNHTDLRTDRHESSSRFYERVEVEVEGTLMRDSIDWWEMQVSSLRPFSLECSQPTSAATIKGRKPAILGNHDWSDHLSDVLGRVDDWQEARASIGSTWTPASVLMTIRWSAICQGRERYQCGSCRHLEGDRRLPKTWRKVVVTWPSRNRNMSYLNNPHLLQTSDLTREKTRPLSNFSFFFFNRGGCSNVPKRVQCLAYERTCS